MVTYALAFWSYVGEILFILKTGENGVLTIEYCDALKGILALWRLPEKAGLDHRELRVVTATDRPRRDKCA